MFALGISHVTGFTEDLHHTKFFFITILFHCRLSDVNLGRLVHGEDSNYLVSPIAGAVMELLEDLGELFYHEYSINSKVA